jgi:hypothetical protein
MIGGGKTLLGRTLMLHMGMGLLDRETGKLRYFAEGREDSLAMSVVAADGSIYVAHSPLRRAVGKAMYPDLTPDVTGGIARFKPIRLDLLAQSMGGLTPDDLPGSVTFLTTACAMFD